MRPSVVSALKFGAVDPKRSLNVAKLRWSSVLNCEGKEPTEGPEARHPFWQLGRTLFGLRLLACLQNEVEDTGWNLRPCQGLHAWENAIFDWRFPIVAGGTLQLQPWRSRAFLSRWRNSCSSPCLRHSNGIASRGYTHRMPQRITPRLDDGGETVRGHRETSLSGVSQRAVPPLPS
jgi:hypothetical protein